MTQSEIIIEANDCKYLAEFLEDLPDNSFVNKVLTGCGNTYLALTCKRNYVITVPFISLIKNKLNSHKNVLGVYGETTDEEIENYLNSNLEYKKILVTYDSLARITNHINPQEYKILIDEAHKLIDSASFRTNAIETVLENYQLYNSYCFATATPVKDKYQLPELVDIQKYKINWNNIKPVNIEYCKYPDNLNKRIAVLIIKFLKDELIGNPYFFINSVTSIIQIIKELKKAGYNNSSLFKIICSNNKDNSIKIHKHLGKDYNIEFTTDPIKRVTFCTATLFEGSDLYDKDGITYIVTDGTKDHTKYDILTTLPQIIGRLRDSKYRDTVYVILSPSYYFAYTSVHEFEQEIRRQLKLAEGFVLTFNQTDNEMVRNGLEEVSECNLYILKRNGTLKVNTSVLYNEMHNYEALHTQYYYKDFASEGDSATLLINTIPHNFIKANLELNIEGLNKLRLSKKPSFKDLCIDYIKCKEENVPTQIRDIELEYPIIAEAYNTLGSEKMKALKYRKTAMEEELLVNSQIENPVKIVSLLDLRVGDIISKEFLKMRIQTIYNQLGIKKNAKATDVTDWYTVKNMSKRVEGEVVASVKIITCNIRM